MALAGDLALEMENYSWRNPSIMKKIANLTHNPVDIKFKSIRTGLICSQTKSAKRTFWVIYILSSQLRNLKYGY